jgi:hypothetical protein
MAMPIPARALRPLAFAGLVALAATGCGAAGASPSLSPSTAGPSTPAPSAVPSSAPSLTETEAPSAPDLTPVPGGTSPSPDDSYGGGPTTETEWGRVLVRIPDEFPVYPGALTADPLPEPATAGWLASDDAETVATWYVDAFEALGWSRIDLQTPLEDGTRVLDLGTDLPECRVQTTFRPANESTMIIVQYGAGCAGGDG